jgi:cyclohexyl-isocyanide hydratase
MGDERVLDFIARRAAVARIVVSVCTGTLLCGAVGLLRGLRATTHRSVLHLLPFFGAGPVDARVVRDGSFLFAGRGGDPAAHGLRGKAAVQQRHAGDRVRARARRSGSGRPRTDDPA